MTIDLFVSYIRAMLYPVIILGLFLLWAMQRRGSFLFLAMALWKLALWATLILRLMKWDAWYNFVVSYTVTPLLALLAVAIWRTLWQVRKRP